MSAFRKPKLRRETAPSGPAERAPAPASRAFDQVLALLVEDLVAGERGHGVEDLHGFVRNFRDALETPRRVEVVARSSRTVPAPDTVRFDTLLGVLARDVPPLSFARATSLCRHLDRLSGSRAVKENAAWMGDVGLHARRASSTMRRGRVLTAITRVLRPRRVLELGTGYGFSTRCIAEELDALGDPAHSIDSVELTQTQLDAARSALDGLEGLSLHRADVGDWIGGLEPGRHFDLVFHDAGHTGEAYVRDFDALAPHLDPGAVVVLDDIRWSGLRLAKEDPETYRGWLHVAAHPRVARAVELDRTVGMVLLG